MKYITFWLLFLSVFLLSGFIEIIYQRSAGVIGLGIITAILLSVTLTKDLEKLE